MPQANGLIFSQVIRHPLIVQKVTQKEVRGKTLLNLPIEISLPAGFGGHIHRIFRQIYTEPFLSLHPAE